MISSNTQANPTSTAQLCRLDLEKMCDNSHIKKNTKRSK